MFSYLGLAWANSSAEVARYQRRRSSGAAAMLWATFGAGLPPFILISFGGLLAASDPATGRRAGRRSRARAVRSRAARLALRSRSSWPSLGGLVSGLVLTIYSGGFTPRGAGRLASAGDWSTVVVGIAVGLAGACPDRGVQRSLRHRPRRADPARGPVAAWAGLFSAEMMMRHPAVPPELALAARRRVRGLALDQPDDARRRERRSVSGWSPPTCRGCAGRASSSRLLRSGPARRSRDGHLGVIVALVLGVLTPLAHGHPRGPAPGDDDARSGAARRPVGSIPCRTRCPPSVKSSRTSGRSRAPRAGMRRGSSPVIPPRPVGPDPPRRRRRGATPSTRRSRRRRRAPARPPPAAAARRDERRRGPLQGRAARPPHPRRLRAHRRPHERRRRRRRDLGGARATASA